MLIFRPLQLIHVNNHGPAVLREMLRVPGPANPHKSVSDTGGVLTGPS
jgi:hypothetical protein